MTMNLFDDQTDAEGTHLPLTDGAVLLRGLALPHEGELHSDLIGVIEQAPLRHLVTPGGLTMSVAMTNCGSLGWLSDRRGYRYDAIDPVSGKPWPPMPDSFIRLAAQAAASAGFDGFSPDACLINRYAPGTRLSLHQDRDENDRRQPIVSVSLGLPATFLFGGLQRSDKAMRVPLSHGDVVVWGGPARLAFHGVLPVKEGVHPFMGACRMNLTFRKAG